MYCLFNGLSFSSLYQCALNFSGVCVDNREKMRERQTDGQTRKEGTTLFVGLFIVLFSVLRPVVPLSPAELVMLQLLFQY